MLDGATTIPLVMTTFGKLGPSAESYLQSLADVACSTGVVNRGLWLRIAKQFLSCAWVRGRGIVFRQYYNLAIARVLLKMLGNNIMMVLSCHSSECGRF